MHRLVAPVVAALVALTVWVGSFGWWEPVPGERWDTRLIANSTLHSFCDLNLNSWDEYALLASGGIATKAIILASTGPRRTHATLVLVETTLYAWTLATCANLWAQEPRPTYNRAPQPVDGDILMSYASRHATVSACIAVFAALVTSAHASWHPLAWMPLVWSLAVVVQRSTHRKHHPWSAIIGWLIGAVAAVWAFSRYQLSVHSDTRSTTLGRQRGGQISGVGFGVQRNGEMEICKSKYTT